MRILFKDLCFYTLQVATLTRRLMTYADISNCIYLALTTL